MCPTSRRYDRKLARDLRNVDGDSAGQETITPTPTEVSIEIGIVK
jgi:hypothetical protein